MAHSQAVKDVFAALEGVNKDNTTLLEMETFRLCAEVAQFQRLREEKVAGKILEERLDRIFTMVQRISKDWDNYKQFQLELDEVEQERETARYV